MGSSTRAVITAAVTGMLALASVWYLPMVVVLGVSVLLFAAGWPRLVGLPAVNASRVVIALTAAASIAVVTLGEVGDLVVVLGLSVAAAFVAEMLRSDGRPRLVESVSGTFTGGAIVASGAAWLGLGDARAALAVVLTAAAALAAGAACTALPVRPQLVATAATLVAAGAGVVAGLLLASVGPLAGALIGLAAGILTSAIHLLFGRLPSVERPLPALAASMVPLLLAGAPTFIVGSTVFG
ncbi:hypothetical protein [Georgenia sp. MJ170]|uniref:hypothetical protein n=1 Tax=Georgenia sunbinii TaxID=3117728 RepID=UPI002F263EFB